MEGIFQVGEQRREDPKWGESAACGSAKAGDFSGIHWEARLSFSLQSPGRGQTGQTWQTGRKFVLNSKKKWKATEECCVGMSAKDLGCHGVTPRWTWTGAGAGGP